MSTALTLARPYARAAFALAKEHGRLPAWSGLLRIAATIAAEPRVAALLGHPGLDAGQAVELVSPPGEIDPNFRGFLAALADNQRLPLLPEIAGLYGELRAEEERVVKARVISAVPVQEVEIEKIRAALAKRFGKSVEIETEIDPELIGGAVIDAGEVVIDGSIRGKLQRLGSAIAH